MVTGFLPPIIEGLGVCYFRLYSIHRWFAINVSVLLSEDKRTIKRQLYSTPFTLREAAFYLSALVVRTQCSASLPVFAHSCPKHRP